MESGVLWSVESGVATLTLRNPARRNAMTPAMWRDLTARLSHLATDPTLRALVLTGHGDTFCAGADIASLRRDTAPRELATGAEEALAAFPVPTLAVIRGSCVGGGCQLAVACDLRFATEEAVFGVTPARLGIVYPASAARRLARLVGPSAAKYLLFSAELIDADRASRTGLVDEVLPAEALTRRVAEFTAVLTSRSALTQRAAKESVDGDGPLPREREAYWRARESAEVAEGVAAFLARRPPRFRWPGPGEPEVTADDPAGRPAADSSREPDSPGTGSPVRYGGAVRGATGRRGRPGGGTHVIRAAEERDVPVLREIERRAGAAFIALDMAAVAEDEPPSAEALGAYLREGRAWVHVDADDQPVAYALVDLVDGAVHLEQVSVDPDHARRRVGAGLIEHIDAWAAAQGASALTLTAFADVPWNAPYYERCGFRRLADDELTPGLRRIRAAEAAHGLDRWPRVCLRRALRTPGASGRETPSTRSTRAEPSD